MKRNRFAEAVEKALRSTACAANSDRLTKPQVSYGPDCPHRTARADLHDRPQWIVAPGLADPADVGIEPASPSLPTLRPKPHPVLAARTVA